MIEYDLVIVGAGSGNMLPSAGLSGMRVAIIERGPFGGTCLNRGCIPSKMLVYTADVAETVREADRYGIHAELRGADWPAIRDRVFTRIDHNSDEALNYRRSSGVDVYLGEAHFVAPKVLEVDGQELHGERIVIAAGSRPRVPDIAGLVDVPFHTTDNVMRLDARPESMVILGGSYVAAEMGHLFDAFGTAVTMIDREPRLLATLDEDLSKRFTDINARRFDARLGAKVTRVEQTPRGVAVHLEGGTRPGIVEAESLFVATGRVPNTDGLDVAACGIAVDDSGKIVTDDTLATNVPGVWAIGDIVNHFELKHLANAQMRIAMHNLLHPDDLHRANFPAIPAAVFADPQIATVGPTERALRDDGAQYVVARREYADTAYGWALEDTTSFVKLIADPQTRRLLAAHIIGPEAAGLIQPLVQAIFLGNTIDQLAYEVLYIHPAITEVIAQALLALARHKLAP